jgi:hypothetical protein
MQKAAGGHSLPSPIFSGGGRLGVFVNRGDDGIHAFLDLADLRMHFLNEVMFDFREFLEAFALLLEPGQKLVLAEGNPAHPPKAKAPANHARQGHPEIEQIEIHVGRWLNVRTFPFLGSPSAGVTKEAIAASSCLCDSRARLLISATEILSNSSQGWEKMSGRGSYVSAGAAGVTWNSPDPRALSRSNFAVSFPNANEIKKNP